MRLTFSAVTLSGIRYGSSNVTPVTLSWSYTCGTMLKDAFRIVSFHVPGPSRRSSSVYVHVKLLTVWLMVPLYSSITVSPWALLPRGARETDHETRISSSNHMTSSSTSPVSSETGGTICMSVALIMLTYTVPNVRRLGISRYWSGVSETCAAVLVSHSSGPRFRP